MTVLIVDDEPLIIQDIASNIDLGKLGISKLLTAFSAASARVICEQNNVNLIICDVEMPRENGISFLKWAKEQYPEIRSIIITSYPVFQYAQDAVKLGCQDYILKPIDIEDLERAIGMASQGINLENSSSLSGHVRKAKYYIERNISNDVMSRTDVAAHVFLNPDYLDRRFKNELGCTISQYISKTRVEKAKKLLLNSSKSLLDIAMETGFANQSNFSTAFRQATGETPRSFRQAGVKSEEA